MLTSSRTTQGTDQSESYRTQTTIHRTFMGRQITPGLAIRNEGSERKNEWKAFRTSLTIMRKPQTLMGAIQITSRSTTPFRVNMGKEGLTLIRR